MVTVTLRDFLQGTTRFPGVAYEIRVSPLGLLEHVAYADLDTGAQAEGRIATTGLRSIIYFLAGEAEVKQGLGPAEEGV